MNVLPTLLLLTNFHQVSCLPNETTGSQCVSFPFHWQPHQAGMSRLRLDGLGGMPGAKI